MKQGDLIAGRYRLQRPIGSGATGTVWAARHELLDREFALKLAAERPGQSERGSREARAMFLREVRIVGKLRHPNIVDIADAGELGPSQGLGLGLYLAMELLLGQSLAQHLAAGPVGPGEALAILSKVAHALATAHGAGVIHRDIKPANIFLARGLTGGVVPKLLDFGVSSAQGITTLSRGHLFGTPAYMSPEQALGEEDIDCRTDVWAIGVVLYEMLTGGRPFDADSYPALLPRIIEAPYAALPASVPLEVRTVVAGCLAKDRADRYASAGALVEAIDRALATLPPDSSATSSAFFIETSPGVPASSRGAALSSGGRGPRRSLALAIFAVPVVIGLAAAASGVRSSHAPAYAPPAEAKSPAPVTAPPVTSEPSVVAPSAVPAASAPARAATAAPMASVRIPAAPRPRVPGGSVSRVNNAGF